MRKGHSIGVILALVLLVSLGVSYVLSAQTAASSRADLAWTQSADVDLFDLSTPVEGGNSMVGVAAQAAMGATVDSSLIQPESDLEYLGAFRLPDEEVNDASWSYGGHGMSYYPQGDPSGAADGHPGSLFGIGSFFVGGYVNQYYVSEVTIPAPFISPGKDVGDLPVAETLQPFTDVTAGRQTGSSTGTTLSDIQYYPRQGGQTSDKLYWVMYEWFQPEADQRGHGWCELDFSNLQSQGVWGLDGFSFVATSQYLFDVPESWADAHTPGKYLVGGRFRQVPTGSWGPALYAFGPWNDGAPPPDGSLLDAVELLKYDRDRKLRDYSHSDQWDDGAWLTIGNKSAVIIAGLKAFRTWESDLEYYGVPDIDDCGYKGYHGGPYYGAILFYDPEILAEVAQGTIEPHQVQPYATFNVDDYMFRQGCRRPILGGVGYDRQNGLLYVMEKQVEGTFATKPIVHVFQVSDQAQPPDHIPPTVPTNLSADGVTSEQVDFSWDGSHDDVHLVGYVIYRNGAPIAATLDISYSDDKINPSATYSYTVIAWDSRNNRSAQSIPLVVTTPAGPDSRAPLIFDTHATDITENSMVINWKTDEPATSRVRYEMLYTGIEITVQDDTLTTTHRLVLSGLTPNRVYRCHVASVDAASNENEFGQKDFRTSTLGGTENFSPVINGIGSRRVYEGELLQFTISADDKDREALVYSATGLPRGASFDTITRQFSWTPRPGDADVYQVTFTASDGDQSHSEEIAIFVQGGPGLVLYGTPADRAIHLNWTVGNALPTSSTWHIDYYTQTATAPLTKTGILSPTRAYTLTELSNGDWYTVTLHAMVDTMSWLSDTVRVMPAGEFVYLPLVLREN